LTVRTAGTRGRRTGSNTNTLLGSLYLFDRETRKVGEYYGEHEWRLFSSIVENVGEEASRFILPHSVAQEMTESREIGLYVFFVSIDIVT